MLKNGFGKFIKNISAEKKKMELTYAYTWPTSLRRSENYDKR